jgi:hypothetical protein
MNVSLNIISECGFRIAECRGFDFRNISFRNPQSTFRNQFDAKVKISFQLPLILALELRERIDYFKKIFKIKNAIHP